MLDVLVIVLFSKQIGRWAKGKGYNGGLFRGLVIAAWFSLEVIGAVLGFLLFIESGFEYAQIPILLLAMLGAGAGIMTIFFIVLSLPRRATAAAAEMPPLKSEAWVCPDCGYRNTSWDKKCFGCKAEKRDLPSAAAPGEPWTCPVCGYKNTYRADACFSCRHERQTTPG